MRLLVAVVLSCTAALAGAESFAVRDVRLFDGKATTGRTTVLVREGRIEAVGVDLPVPAGLSVVEGRGRTLLPGFFDAHVHVRTPEELQQALAYGVTTALDMFTLPGTAAALRAEQEAGGGLDRSDLRSAGFLVTAPGGHGTEYGVPIPTLAGPAEAQAFVDARLAEGSDYVKVVVDDGSAFGGAKPTLGRETLLAVVAAAHARGKLAVAHVATAKDAREALESGADGIAHAWAGPPDAALVRLAAEKRVFVTPTLVALEGTKRLVEVQGGKAPSLTEVRGLVRQLAEAGVPLLAGSDMGAPGTEPGWSLHRELELLVEAGLSPAQALQAATSAPARAFSLDDRGRIAPGPFRADLVLVEGDPTKDIGATRRTIGVWKRGVRAKLAAPR